MEEGLGPSAGAARPTPVSVGVPPMSKAERLHRWAASLELHTQSRRAARRGATHAHRPAESEPSPLALALDDWAFQAEGLRTARPGDVRAFFDLSEDEMRRILGSAARHTRRIPAVVAAERIRELAVQAEGTPEPECESFFASVRSSRWFPSAADHRRESGTAGAA